jgi:hypothetical protein
MTHETVIKTYAAQLALEEIRARGIRVSGTGTRRRFQAGERSSTPTPVGAERLDVVERGCSPSADPIS